MIINLLFWGYLTVICLIWGNLFIQILVKTNITIPETEEFGFVCLMGLSVIGCIALYVSIFFAMDWRVHSLIVLPAILYCFSSTNRKLLRYQINSCFKYLSIKAYFFLGGCIIMLLLLSSYKIIHPDTLAYHAQSIQWFQKYRVVPGLVHLKLELGFQSIWFAIQALFNPIPDTISLTSSGGCVVCWFLLVIVRKLEPVPTDKNLTLPRMENAKWGWFILLIYSLVSWTQIRLTAASESPDFIVSWLILSAIYFFFQASLDRRNKEYYFFISTLFSCSAVSGKLSSICISLIPIILCIYFLIKGRFKALLSFAIFAFVIIIPVLVRNLIVSGYLLYPSAYVDLFNPDWKLNSFRLHNFQDYITSYARFPINYTETANYIGIPFSQWTPIWWKHLAIPDQALLGTIFLLGILNFLFLKSFIKKTRDIHFSTILFIALSGSFLWFIKAPDPRFGSGFLLALVYIIYMPLKGKTDFWVSQINRTVFTGMIWVLGFGLIAYSAYRFHNFFTPKEILIPAGIAKLDYKQIKNNRISINIVTDSGACGLTPIPCITRSTLDFIPRGEAISNGFKGR